MNKTWLQHKRKRLVYGLSQNRLAAATGNTTRVSKRYWLVEKSFTRRMAAVLWVEVERFNPTPPEMLFDKNWLSDNRRTAGGRKHLTTETVLFSLHEDYGFYLIRYYALGGYIISVPMNWTKGLGGIRKVVWVQTI